MTIVLSVVLLYVRCCSFPMDTGTWSLGPGVGAGTGPDGVAFSSDQPWTSAGQARPRVTPCTYRLGGTVARRRAPSWTPRRPQRSAAEGEHRTGEECLDGIARRCAILPESGDRYTVSRRLVRSGIEAAGFPPLPSLSRAKVPTSPRREHLDSQAAGPRGRASWSPGRASAARSAARRGGVRDGSPKGRDRAAGSMRSTTARPAGRRPCLNFHQARCGISGRGTSCTISVRSTLTCSPTTRTTVR